MSELFDVVQGGELEGFARQRSRMREGAVLSAVQLLADVRTGAVPYYLLSEALQPSNPAMARLVANKYPGVINLSEGGMTRSDFPLLMGDVLERSMLARWGAFPQEWRKFVGVTTRRDFRTGRALTLDGLEGAFSEQAEEEELEYGSLTEASYSYSVKKFSKGAKLSWELLLNDDLNAFSSIPDRLGRGAARTVARFVTDLYTDANGPDATFFSSGNANIVGTNAVLTATSLGTAYGMLRSRVDSQGEPIIIESAVLVVGPGNEVNARNILGATQIWPVSTVGGPVVNNWVPSNLTLAVDPYIPILVTAGTVAATAWFLFASPSVARPAIEVAFLQGYEQPQLYQKVSNTARMGGGVDQMMGDFNTLSAEYKGLLAFGGSLLDPKSAVASKGTGS